MYLFDNIHVCMWIDETTIIYYHKTDKGNFYTKLNVFSCQASKGGNGNIQEVFEEKVNESTTYATDFEISKYICKEKGWEIE